MGGFSIKKKLRSTVPYIRKTAIDTAKGYAFGCVFGIFAESNETSMLEHLHKQGKTFATISCAYTITELALEKCRGKSDAYNSLCAGAAAGYLGGKQNKKLCSSVFGFYSGFSRYMESQ